MKIPFNKARVHPLELEYVRQALESGHLSGDGSFTHKCHRWLEKEHAVPRALLTHSATAALEMAALLANLEPGDEVLMPSYTFVSTANAFALRGATPVFVDIRPDTLNLNEDLLRAALTPKTRVIVPVHYAGVSCEMDPILALAQERNLMVVEDAAQGILASYRGRPLGGLGDLGALSFHESKNVISGEGGALLIRAPQLAQRAEIIREKGTNRSQFFRGETDKYSWVDIGSSYLPGELTAAFLLAQLEQARALIDARMALWERYHAALHSLENSGVLRRPVIPAHCQHNAHMYYLLLPDQETRAALIAHLKARDVYTVFHYVPLHSAPAGRKYGRVAGELPVTERIGETLLRLPLYPDLSFADQDRVIELILQFFEKQ